MNTNVRNLILTESQEACLVALRSRKESKTDIAIRAKLDLKKAEKALEALKELGLAKRDEKNSWHFTRRGRDCRLKVIPDRIRRSSGLPGPGARRLLDALNRPMRGDQLAERLGITLQRVRQLVVKLHAQGLVKFGDPERILEVVSRTKDKTVLLSHDEARVLSAIPDAYATNVTKIRFAVFLPEKNVQQILDRLVARHFVAEQEGFADNTIYRITAVGLKHSQRHQVGRPAHAPRLLFDKCSYAVSLKRKSLVQKSQPRASGALFIDREGACHPYRNGTKTCCITCLHGGGCVRFFYSCG